MDFTQVVALTVFISTRAKSSSLVSVRPLAEHVSACGPQNEAPRRTREKTTGTQGKSPTDWSRYLRKYTTARIE